ncbi:lysine histidine transporter-like 2 isoform X1 [Macadamia integrifolia]|uniref:lysine histidine transporter-like 2 isoform X1 n=1 Tax=Macadamia integrifolia TaxID=60698 RepID=UPI001C531C5A|nr:lysine histidine transporter-like 2 isoform X1 [Macadamia integrifolia]XP_042480851.1 lysine histidine transporter-like 2 isoform X1 [Macadamia integrifolia]
MDEEISKPRGLPEENGRENDAGVQFVLESKGKWWHAGYHLTTAIVGPTILALPYTFSGMGWAVGFLCLTVIGLVTFYAYYLMSKVLDHCEKQGRRHFRFRELAADVFGSGWMFYFVIIVQTAVNTGVAIGTILLSGECIECFAEMLYFFLSGLPRAILKEIDVDDPTEIGEERVKKAFKFFCKLEQLENTIEWSWPAEKFEPESQANDVVHSNSSLVVAAPDCIYSEVEAPNVSNAVVVDRKVGNSDVSLAVVAATCAAEEDEEDDDDDDDEIKEIGSDEIV